jgi:hypothetical protein
MRLPFALLSTSNTFSLTFRISYLSRNTSYHGRHPALNTPLA